MSQYLPQPSDGFLPLPINKKLSKRLDRMEAQTIAAMRADQLAIERSVETTERGMVGITRISLREAALTGAASHAANRLRAAADNGSAVVIGHILQAGF